jgi:hypothetical protein
MTRRVARRVRSLGERILIRKTLMRAPIAITIEKRKQISSQVGYLQL